MRTIHKPLGHLLTIGFRKTKKVNSDTGYQPEELKGLQKLINTSAKSAVSKINCTIFRLPWI